ncbi:MAG: glycerate kinase [Bacteroidales bacterium]|nr:glycerate kinase [Bacteroidales bacterium]
MNTKSYAEQIFRSGVDRVLPDQLIRSQVKIADHILYLADHPFPLDTFHHIYVIGAGKASALMASELESILGERITQGHIVVKQGHTCALKRMRITEAAHPIPDQKGVQATKELLEIVNKAGKDDLVICLISGGASSLLADYPEGSSLDDLVAMNRLLIESGADIQQINTVRKHLSKVKGGQLAKAIDPACFVSFILSDVIGDPLDVIASGPTTPDSSTFADAWHVLEELDLLPVFPLSMVNYLRMGMDGLVPETPKPGDPLFARGHSLLIGNNTLALEAAKEKALELGFEVRILTSALQREVRKVADFILDEAVKIQNDPAVKKPFCLLAGGEPTIKVTGRGIGGRNQHFALYCATRLEGKQGITVLCAGSDGTDGPTDAAGAVVDGDTLRVALEKKIDSRVYLEACDSYSFFRQVGGHIMTGNTRTNVMDLVVVIILPVHPQK